ncbi:MAG: nucleotidyltransferase domain-containing protein [Dehalococcoidia bacterium]
MVLATLPPPDAIREICERWGIVELSIFGSAMRDDFRDDSDIDLLFVLEPGHKIGFIELGTIEDELKAVFGRPVDLVSKRGLNKLIRDEVLSATRTVYAA